MRPTYFTSDWHLGHANCLEFDSRPFVSLEEMHIVLIKNFNSLVPKSGLTYFLGDMSMGNIDLIREVVEQLHGDKILILGNHDKRLGRLEEIFTAVMYSATISIAGELITLSHCPKLGVFREDTSSMKWHIPGEHWHGEHRNIKFAVHDHGQFHLHGHLHCGSPRNKNINTGIIDGRQWDIGVVGNNYKPVSNKQVHQWICRTKAMEATCPKK